MGELGWGAGFSQAGQLCSRKKWTGEEGMAWHAGDGTQPQAEGKGCSSWEVLGASTAAMHSDCPRMEARLHVSTGLLPLPHFNERDEQTGLTGVCFVGDVDAATSGDGVRRVVLNGASPGARALHRRRQHVLGCTLVQFVVRGARLACRPSYACLLRHACTQGVGSLIGRLGRGTALAHLCTAPTPSVQPRACTVMMCGYCPAAASAARMAATLAFIACHTCGSTWPSTSTAQGPVTDTACATGSMKQHTHEPDAQRAPAAQNPPPSSPTAACQPHTCAS